MALRQSMLPKCFKDACPDWLKINPTSPRPSCELRANQVEPFRQVYPRQNLSICVLYAYAYVEPAYREMPQSTPPNCALPSIRGTSMRCHGRREQGRRLSRQHESDSDLDLTLNRAAVLHEGFETPLENRIGCGG